MGNNEEADGARFLPSESLAESIETVEIWLDIWADNQADVEEIEPGDIEERKVIQAMRDVLREVKPRKRESCPHAAPNVYCVSCCVSPCPLGLGKAK